MARSVPRQISRRDPPSIPKMVDVSEKPVIKREAVAEGTIYLRKSTMELIESGKIEKGDPLQIATFSAIQAIKNTPNSLVMCHPIPIEGSSVEFDKTSDSITVRVKVVASSKTGVEMDALNAVSVALLNIWDVVKKYEKNVQGQYPDTRIADIHVVRKFKGAKTEEGKDKT